MTLLKMIDEKHHGISECWHNGKQNGRYFAKDIFKYIFSNKNCCILIGISVKFVSKVQLTINHRVIAWHCSGDRPLPEPMKIHCSDTHTLIYIYIYINVFKTTRYFATLGFVFPLVRHMLQTREKSTLNIWIVVNTITANAFWKANQ